MAFLLNEWRIRDVRITSKTTAVIDLYIPGVNQRDRADVKLNVFDRLMGRTIVEKALLVRSKWEDICQKKNRERDEAKALTDRLNEKIYGE